MHVKKSKDYLKFLCFEVTVINNSLTARGRIFAPMIFTFGGYSFL